MVKTITSYEDSNGKMHRNAYDAHIADLALWLAQSDHINDASAVKLTGWLSEPSNAVFMISTLEQIIRNAPSEAVSQ